MSAPSQSSSSTRLLPSRLRVSGLWGLVGIILAASAAGFSDHRPTGLSWWDSLLTVWFVVVVALAVSVAPHWFWFLSLAVNAALAENPRWAGVALAGLVLALLVEATRSQFWPISVAVGMLVAHGLLHLSMASVAPSSRFGVPSAVAGAMSLLAVVAALLRADEQWRKPVRLLAMAMLLVTIGAAGLGGLAAAMAQEQVADGSEAARAGLEAARDGDVDLAAGQLDRSVVALADADATLNSWWIEPARLVPVVSQHVEVARVATSRAGAVATAAGVALVDADIEKLKVSGGAIDVDLIASMAAPLAEVESSLTTAVEDLGAARSPWLLPQLDRQLDEVLTEMADAVPDARKAADATRLLPGLLGHDEPRRYLVLFGTPAEARELGGIVGNVIELTVDNGKVEITNQMRDGELNQAGPGRLEDRNSYPARYLINQPEVFAQNWSGMTDLPSVARAVADLYPSMGGRSIDGVLYADPYGIAALMEFTGPVEVPELGRSLGADTVVPFLLVGQYETFEQDDRVDFLDQIALVTFSRLLSADLPSPRRVGDVLGPAARQGRLQMATFDADENAFLDTLFLLGDLPANDGGDHLAVVHANGGADKLDGFLQRTVHYDAVLDPDTGAIAATVTVELTNNVPEGLPDYVIGREGREIPPATNRVHLSIYTPHELRALRVQGRDVDPELQQELGYQRYLTFVDVAPGRTMTVTFELEGAVDLSAGSYRLTVAPQAVANPDRVTIGVEAGARRFTFDDLVVEDTVFELPLG
jgi:hypothetical protein